MLQVYTGTGKGKTTAALGVALRASGYGMKTLMLSFLKDDPEYGEARAAKNLPWFTLRQVGRDAFVNFHNPDPVDLKMCRDGWEEAKEAISSHAADIIILDELNIVLATQMLPTRRLLIFCVSIKITLRLLLLVEVHRKSLLKLPTLLLI